METMSRFFEYINQLLGVSSPGELLFHPVFIGLCIAVFIYAVATGTKYVSIPLGGIMGGGVIWHYLYPKESGQLGDLAQFVGAMIVLGFVMVYIAFIRD